MLKHFNLAASLIFALIITSGVLMTAQFFVKNFTHHNSDKYDRSAQKDGDSDKKMPNAESVIDFKTCEEAGYPVMESYPRQCSPGDDRVFVEEVILPVDPPVEDDVNNNNDCAVTGCSSHICTEKATAGDIVTTCEWKEGYACYRSALCERQASGECGWTQTEELQLCLGIEKPIAKDRYPIGQEGIPQGCTLWYDGCNNCHVGDGGPLACTKRYCIHHDTPKCLKYE